MIAHDIDACVASVAPLSIGADTFPFRCCPQRPSDGRVCAYAPVRLLTTMPRRPASLRHRAVIGRRRLLGEIRHLQAAEQLLVRTLRALAVEGAALQAIVAAESSGSAAPAVGTTFSANFNRTPLLASLTLGLGDVVVTNDGERMTGSAPATEAVNVETATSSVAAPGAGASSIADMGSASLEFAGDGGATGPASAVRHFELANLRNAFDLDEDDDDFDF